MFEAFAVSTGAVALGEIGNMTPVVTELRAVTCPALPAVVLGTALGMMIASGPAEMLGERAAEVVQAHWVHRIAAAVSALLGLAALASCGDRTG
jgi:putative Ca2+/H+ antiporter (TMEM165/GDT1 family)